LLTKRCMARACRCTAMQGKGVVVLGARCRAGMCAEWGQAGSRHTGMGCTLWTRWAARWRRTGMGGQRCTATLERNWLRELVRWVKMVLVAR
jgi:hypothetical protein